MELDRAIIKSQAKQLIKGRVLALFAIAIVVTLLTNGTNIIVSINNSNGKFAKNPLSGFSERLGGIDDIDDLEDYLEEYEDEYGKSADNGIFKASFLSKLTRLGNIINILCMPLTIMLAGVFIMLIRGKPFGLYDEFTFVFKNTFNKDYFDKLLLTFLRSLFTFLWTLLFIVPGIVYNYKVSLALCIKYDYPELTWKDCLEASKKMTDGHKGELFVLDLSFIPWFLLLPLTFGIAGIYIIPYYLTTRALYYENFKRRALATGEINETDLMTEAQKYALFVQQNPNANHFTPIPNRPPVQQQYYAPVQQQNVQVPPVMPPAAPTQSYTPPVQSAPAPEADAPAVNEQPTVTENTDNETF